MGNCSPPRSRPIRPGEPTGTFVGQKVVQLRGELDTLRRSIASHNDQLQTMLNQTAEHGEGYHQLVASIKSRLQRGTTRGNPILTRRWGDAQQQLNRIDGDIVSLSDLANRIATDAALADYLLSSVRASYDLSGAVEEDHRQLAILEDEVKRTHVLVERLVGEAERAIERQSKYVEAERRNMQALSEAIKRGERYQGTFSAPPPTGDLADLPRTASDTARDGPGAPVVVIRFDRPDVEYERPLYNAMNRVLQERPDAVFQVLAVSPATRGSVSATAQRNANAVARSMREMGLPENRVRVGSRPGRDADGDEVHIHVL